MDEVWVSKEDDGAVWRRMRKIAVLMLARWNRGKGRFNFRSQRQNRFIQGGKEQFD